MRGSGVALLLVSSVFAADPAEMAEKAKERMDAVEERWNQFVFDKDKLTDEDLRAMADVYDEAIEIFQTLSEQTESAASNSTILVLARRTAKLRATIFAREMRRKAAEAAERRAEEAKNKPADEAPKQAPKEAPPDDDGEDGEDAGDATPSGERRALRRIEIVETKEERAANVRRLRKFVFDYFRQMKPQVIRTACSTCRGQQQLRVKKVQGGRYVFVKVDCPACKAVGFTFNPEHARRALWMTMTPTARADPGKRKEYEEWVARYTETPADLDPIERLAIQEVDYRGLWAKVTWEEKRGRDKVTVTREFVRLGRSWYFYSEQHDAEFISVPEDEPG